LRDGTDGSFRTERLSQQLDVKTIWKKSIFQQRDNFMRLHKLRCGIVGGVVLALFVVCLAGADGATLGDLEGYWTFDNSGNLGQDSGPNGNNLNNTGTPTYVAGGKFGGAVNLDGDQGGSSDALTQGATFPTGIPTGTASYSVSAWVNADTDNPNGGLISWGNNASNQKNAHRFSGNNAYHHYWWDNDLGTPDVGYQEDGNWHHYVATYDDTPEHHRRLYVDGVFVAQKTTGNLPNVQPTNFFLGRAANTAETLNGRLDDVGVFSHVLSDGGVTVGNPVDPGSEIGFLYNGGTGNTIAALIPEPSTLMLAILSLLGLGLLGRRRRR